MKRRGRNEQEEAERLRRKREEVERKNASKRSDVRWKFALQAISGSSRLLGIGVRMGSFLAILASSFVFPLRKALD